MQQNYDENDPNAYQNEVPQEHFLQHPPEYYQNLPPWDPLGMVTSLVYEWGIKKFNRQLHIQLKSE